DGGSPLHHVLGRVSEEGVTRGNADFTNCWSCPTHRAVRHFADVAFDALAREVVGQIQDIDATGIFDDDCQHLTLWDEYCHYVQNGPHELLDAVWEETVTPFFTAAVANVP